MAIGELTGSIGNFVLNIVVIIFSFIFFAVVALTAGWGYIQRNKYKQFKCVIWGRDGFGQITQTRDKAGIFIDRKTKNKRFFLKKMGVGLNPDNVPYIISSGGRFGSEKVVYLFRKGLKNFVFIKPNIDGEFKIDVGEEDVNWAVNNYDRTKKIFGTSLLMQILPFVAIAFVSMVILILFIYLFKQMGVIADAAHALEGAANAMVQVKSGTLVLT